MLEVGGLDIFEVVGFLFLACPFGVFTARVLLVPFCIIMRTVRYLEECCNFDVPCLLF